MWTVWQCGSFRFYSLFELFLFQEIYEVKQTENGFIASSICRHDVGLQAPMNGAIVSDGKHHMFAGGLDDECHLFSLKYKITSPTKSGIK